MKDAWGMFLIGLGAGLFVGGLLGKHSATVDQRIINQRDSLRNALESAKLDSIKLEGYYQRKLKEVEK